MSAWRRTSLGEICEIQLGKMLSPRSKVGPDPVPYLRNANVLWNGFDLRNVAKMDFDDREKKKFELKPGDLLVCEGGEPGRSAVWEGQIQPCYYQKALHRLRPKSDQVDPRFLMFRLWLGGLSSEFSDSHSKTTIAHLPAVRLATLPIALPSIKEQREIVRRLVREFSLAESARAAAEARLEAARALSEAIVRGVFESDEANGWSRASLSQVLQERGQYGLSVKTHSDVKGLPVLRIGNISGGEIDWRDLKYVELPDSEVSKYRLSDGDLLFNRTNSAELVGKTAVFRDERDALFASYLIRFRLKPEAAVPDFICAYFNSRGGRSYIREKMTRAI